MCVRPLGWLAAGALLLPACTGTTGWPAEFATDLANAPADAEVRLWLADGQLSTAAVHLGPLPLPTPVRAMLEAIAPDGTPTFVGREYGPHGTGFRIDKSYAEPPHRRSVLLADDGRVLERSHTVPLLDVPQHVLAAALRVGAAIETSRIVSGALAETHWELLVRDRGGVLQSCRIGLDGRLLGQQRRFGALVDS